jgi:ribosomal protein S14
MDRLYRAKDLAEAHLLRDLLEEDGLHACIVNENLASLAGELPFGLIFPEVWITDSRDLFMARAVLKDYLQRKGAPDRGERRCVACGEESPGNFDLCWSCRRPFEPR